MRAYPFWLFAGLLTASIWITPSHAADWAEFHGPKRDARSTETGLLSSWPASGPKLLWSMKGLGTGYSTLSIVGDKFYTMGDVGGKQQVLAFDLPSRKQLWAAPVGPTHRDGARCTPTVAGDRLFALGTDGDLVCLETATGKEVWRKNLAKDFGGKMMSVWKFSESPLLDGEKLLVTPGGPEATIVALKASTGETIWKCAAPSLGDKGGDGAGYSSMVVAEIGGVRQYVQLFGRGVIGVEAATGKFLWGYNRVANKVANITTPIVRGDHVFVTTSYKTGSALLKIEHTGDKWEAKEVYWLDYTAFANHHGGVVLDGDYIYGGDGQNGGAPVCLEFLTGKIVWKEKPIGKRSAAVLYADGRLYFRYEGGTVALIEATPKGLSVTGTFEPPSKSGPAWPHPVIVDKKLYLRDNDTLMCYDLAQ